MPTDHVHTYSVPVAYHVPEHGWFSWRCDCGIGGHGFNTRDAADLDASNHYLSTHGVQGIIAEPLTTKDVWT